MGCRLDALALCGDRAAVKIQQVWRFGSIARDEEGPGSDGDLLAIVREAREPFPEPEMPWRVGLLIGFSFTIKKRRGTWPDSRACWSGPRCGKAGPSGGRPWPGAGSRRSLFLDRSDDCLTDEESRP
ncbi:nucleotidyltransferase domain-containing protein [Thermoflexus sp.]|uniref:nucleotidyltransferase domain-containing protein n=1 Tax=Thermoflexus sp. TaxID=1969742 RepID=UPI0033348B82